MASHFGKVLDNYLFHICKNLFYYIVGNGITGLMLSILPVTILLYGGYLVFHKYISLGTLIAFYTYLGYLNEPIRNLSDYHLMLQNTLGMCERVLSLLDNDRLVDQGTVPMAEFQGLEFDQVSFAYEEGKPVLDQVSFTVNKGDRVMIVGHSGSGKSTILNLIMKLYTPQKGKILLNQHNLQQISKDTLYSHITLLEQNNFLFDGTIWDNIDFGKNVDLERVKEVAELANLKGLVEGKPEGLERRISELGTNISGGERQRICLARALIREVDVVLLDEATSALDSAIENEIVTNLDQYLGGRTLIAVSHRPALLNICNKVIHIEIGRVVGCYHLSQKTDYDRVNEIVSQTA